MTTAAPPRWEGARHSTALSETAYLGSTGRLMFNQGSRSDMRRIVRQWLRVARTPEERRRVLDVWRHIHYLGKGGGSVFPPRTIRLSYYMDRNDSLDVLISEYAAYLAHLECIRDHGGLLLTPDGDPAAFMVNPRPFPAAHFATFPREVVEPCVLASTSPMACPHCGAPWRRIVERTGAVHRRKASHTPLHKPTRVDSTRWAPATRSTDRFEPGCSCNGNDGSGRGIVLDPFWGSGTSGEVALANGRVAWGCELNPEYIEISKRRLRRAQTTLLGRV